MKNAIEQAAPIIAAIQDGFLYGQHRAGEPCPQLPDIIRMVGIDDRAGEGPQPFDANQLFDQIDAVIVDCQQGTFIVDTPQICADKARAGDRTLLIATTPNRAKDWARFINARHKLSLNCLMVGIDKGELN